MRLSYECSRVTGWTTKVRHRSNRAPYFLGRRRFQGEAAAPRIGGSTARVYAVTREQALQAPDFIYGQTKCCKYIFFCIYDHKFQFEKICLCVDDIGTIILVGREAHVLVDPGATHEFVASGFAR